MIIAEDDFGYNKITKDTQLTGKATIDTYNVSGTIAQTTNIDAIVKMKVDGVFQVTTLANIYEGAEGSKTIKKGVYQFVFTSLDGSTEIKNFTIA